jgi:hypothetical protein
VHAEQLRNAFSLERLILPPTHGVLPVEVERGHCERNESTWARRIRSHMFHQRFEPCQLPDSRHLESQYEGV